MSTTTKNIYFQSLSETEKFHRPKAPPTFEYFTDEMIDLGNQIIEDVHDLLINDNLSLFDMKTYLKKIND